VYIETEASLESLLESLVVPAKSSLSPSVSADTAEHEPLRKVHTSVTYFQPPSLPLFTLSSVEG
jgi:hypothetical protein